MHKTVLEMGVLDVQGEMLTPTMVKGRAVSLAKMRTPCYNDVPPSRLVFWACFFPKVLANFVKGKLEAGRAGKGKRRLIMHRVVGVPITHCQLSTQEAAAGENEHFGLHAGDIYAQQQQPSFPRVRL